MRRRFARLRLALALTGLAMLIGLGLLLRGALAASAREQELRREALAARVFDELEGSLASFVASEEARPFVQWRREWLAPAATELSSSPLAAKPAQAFVIGYFQIEPDGRFASPMLAETGEPGTPELAERVAVLQTISRDLLDPDRLALADQASTKPDRYPPPVPQQQQQVVPEDVQIQRALDQQSAARQRKNVAAQQQAFAPDLEQLSNFVGPANRLLDSELGLDPSSTDALDVRITKFAVELVAHADGEALRMVRTVDIAGQRWIQAVVLDRAGLASWLEQEVLGSPELTGFVALDWGSGPPADPAAGRWTHTFAAPFGALQVSAELGPVRVFDSTGASSILALGLALALALIGVLVTVERSLAGLLARAEERERFIAAVTHELRTPLTSIRMYSEMLEQGMVSDPARQRSYHGTIRGEAERLSRLVEQVLTLARLDERERGQPSQAGQGEAERASLESVIAGVVELLRPQAEARGLALRVSLDRSVGTAAIARDAFAQILTNLVDNAIKFSRVDGEAIEILGTIKPDSTVSVQVLDRGPGVTAELLLRMFEPFVRGQREHDQAVPGTGIGLAVVEALVADLGGRLRANNREGGGLAIEVTLPAQL